MAKNGGCWGTRGWGFRMKQSKKKPDTHALGKSPRQIRDKINGFRKD